MTGSALAVSGLRHAFPGPAGPVEALDGVDLSVPAGSFAVLVGPSGCGKSTLLKVLAGLLAPGGGSATIAGRETAGRPGIAAFMPQRDLLLPWRRALANAALGAEIGGVRRGEARARAGALFETFGLTGFERAWPSQLSGGMRQRLALLRTFLSPAGVLLLDEPFGALDAITRRTMQQWLQGVWMQDRRTVLLVTHDVEEALFLGDHVHVMSRRPGRIAASVPVDLARPRKAGVVTRAEFVALKAELLRSLDIGEGSAGG